jgi:hypothetical protein
MSWVKKRGQTTPAAPPPQVQMYNPNQHSNQENQWQQQSHDNWYNQAPKEEPKTNYWQQPYQQQQPFNQNAQQYGHYQEYYQNNTAYPPQTYGNLQYNQQYSAQNNVYGAQPPQTEGDGWSSTWGWGDEDNSNIQAPSQNTNVVAESFANDKTWNWSLDEANAKPPPKPVKDENETDPAKVAPSLDRLTGKRNKLETPQWSVESQMSQESSDDILQTSESDKSRMLSRSSTISHSPISGQEPPPGSHLESAPAKEEQVEATGFENKEILSQVGQDASGLSVPPMNSHLDDKSNPYKRNSGLSHKAANKFRSSNVTPPDSRAHNVFPTPFQGQSVNLETLPDNSEQPDPIPVQPARKISSNGSHPWAENNEAPINDRNQYLETAQLSDVDFNQVPESVTQDNDTLPPPGLRRMVPGQTVGGPESIEPPEGLHRMIPGESSSPESSLRQQNAGRGDDSEPEFTDINTQRSATIGADTPPVTASAVVNRSETIGADTSPDPVKPSQGRAKKGRRDSVEGQIQDADLGALVNSVRNLTVGEQLGDEGNGAEGSGRKNSRQESSDSDHEVRPKSPVDRRERRYRDKEERDRNRSRYSPEDYRDKKYDRRRYKDRRYEEDTDYYSDKERERRHRDDREYDRKYSSLRKEKDKDRRRKDDRREYVRDPRKNDYYYGRYEEDYENESRSRASSRSDSMHDSYRDRGHDRDRRDRRHREKDRHRRHRDPFNPYMQAGGFGYDIYSQYYQQYQYYENLRKTNPQAYAQLYRKYYQDASGETPYAGEDRASVHSGRSSANDELAKDSFVRTLDQTDNPLNYEDPHLTAQRLTPAKFATAHVKASISSGKLVKILPNYPLDGQAGTVELCNLESLLHNDEDYQELKRFPGPLIKGTTHKKTIIEYCKNKIRDATDDLDLGDRDSYVLMWELLILLIRQNGMVVGADIAELLLRNRSQEVAQRPPSVVSSVGSNVVEPESVETSNGSTTNLKEEEITNKFREYLLYGSGKEALEWAMKHGLWGHALFLASKLDKRTYANVLMRFANGLTMNDPLQTLYQLLSGRTPAAVTCVADEKWGDWRPHLAMILSNSTQRPELNCKAITILGDTLMGRGSLYAAQFCYLMAEVGFSQYGCAEAKLVLLGSNHNKSFAHFATNEAIHMTEIYEYARSLNDDDFNLVNFQRYKYLLATRLADVGLLEKALSYLEKIANFIVKNPGIAEGGLVNEVALLADRLKYYDPVGDGEEETDFDSSRPDNSWLKDLRRVQNDYTMGLITQQPSMTLTTTTTTHTQEEHVYSQNQDVWQQQQQQQQVYEQYHQQPWSPEQQLEPTPVEYQKQPEQQQQEGYGGTHYQEQQQQQYWPGQQQWSPEQTTTYQEPAEQQYYGAVAHSEDIPQPQISLPNQHDGKVRSDEQNEQPKKDPPAKAAKPAEPSLDKPGGSGWFGGIFSKLSLKPKNQMKLPDDKNPTILWDSEKKRWVNTDEDNADGASDFKPPPKMAEMTPKLQPAPAFNPTPRNVGAEPAQENGNAPKTAQPNIFKLQRNRNLKKSYIDVFNPGAKSGQALPPPGSMGGATGAQQPMNFFVPQPVNDPNAPTDFLTPAPPLLYDENAQVGDQINESAS